MTKKQFVVSTTMMTFVYFMFAAFLIMPEGFYSATWFVGIMGLCVVLMILAGHINPAGYKHKDPTVKEYLLRLLYAALIVTLAKYIPFEITRRLLLLAIGALWGIEVTKAWFKYKELIEIKTPHAP